MYTDPYRRTWHVKYVKVLQKEMKKHLVRLILQEYHADVLITLAITVTLHIMHARLRHMLRPPTLLGEILGTIQALFFFPNFLFEGVLGALFSHQQMTDCAWHRVSSGQRHWLREHHQCPPYPLWHKIHTLSVSNSVKLQRTTSALYLAAILTATNPVHVLWGDKCTNVT